MNKKILNLTLILFICSASFGQNTEQTCRVILKLKNEATFSNTKKSSKTMICNNKIDSIAKKFLAINIKKQSFGKKSKPGFYIIQFPKEANIKQIIDEYYKTNEIEYAEPDFICSGGGKQEIIPNDEYYFRQWGLNNDGSFYITPSIVGADIDMKEAWNIAQGDSNVVVGIIDTGNKFDHPEFSGRIWKNFKEIPNNGIDDDLNGYIDDVQGWDFTNSDNDPTDDNGHGTNVAGIIGANGNNSIGYAGVDWNCKLMILKAIDNNKNGYYSWMIDAIYYAVNNGAKVINMSLGGTSNSITLKYAINYALNNNVTVVACMMNTNSSTIYYPAGIPGVIAVGSTNSNDTRSNPFPWSSISESNFGSHISVVAPGNCIYGLNYQSNTNYSTYWAGTSQATPLVTGIVSLLLSQDSNRTPIQLKSIIETTAEDQVGNLTEDSLGWDQYYGYGRINAFKALTLTTNIILQRLQNKNLSISPNPFSTQTTILTDITFHNATLTVINCLGQKVALIKNISGQSIVFNRGNLIRGIYFIEISENNQVHSINKVIVID